MMGESAQTGNRQSQTAGEQTFATFDASILADELPLLVGVIDDEERYRYVNRAYEEFYGIPRAEILGRTVSELAGPEHYAVAQQYIHRTLHERRQFCFAAALRRPDGSQRDVEVSYTP